MPRIDDITKQQRLDRIHLILTRNSRGLNEAEIAEEVNIDRRTVNSMTNSWNALQNVAPFAGSVD